MSRLRRSLSPAPPVLVEPEDGAFELPEVLLPKPPGLLELLNVLPLLKLPGLLDVLVDDPPPIREV